MLLQLAFIQNKVVIFSLLHFLTLVTFYFSTVHHKFALCVHFLYRIHNVFNCVQS